MSNGEASGAVKILLAAGGTGGHIWPAISFGQWIGKHHPECEVRYVCGSRPLEREIYNAASIKPEVLDIEGSPFSCSGTMRKVKRVKDIFSSCLEARWIVKDFMPDAALSFGGYLSFPVILACKGTGVRCAVHEQNARAGKVTRLASRLGLEVYSGWKECRPLGEKKYLRVGVPVRNFVLPPKEEAWKKLGLEGDTPKGPTAVVLTGSLGSVALKERIAGIASTPAFENWTFIFAAVSSEIRKEGRNLWLLPKIWDTELLYGLADMLVIRAGGSTLTEAGALGIPPLIVPWLGAADNHQYYNALAFVSENTGFMWTEDEGEDALALSLMKLCNISGRKGGRADGLRRTGDVICENLWSVLFPAR